MNEFERFVWALSYTAAILTDAPSAENTAMKAVMHFQRADEHFSDNHPSPPPEWHDEDLPF